MLFAVQFKLVQTTWVRNNTLQQFYHENIIVDYERGPYALFPKSERITIFGFDFKEPARLFLIPPFATKKNKDECQSSGACRHKLLENCGWFLTCITVFHTMCTDVHEVFNFYVDKEVDPDSKFCNCHLFLS